MRPLVRLDVVPLTVQDESLKILLLREGKHWRLPGGVVSHPKQFETIDDLAHGNFSEQALTDFYEEEETGQNILSVGYLVLGIFKPISKQSVSVTQTSIYEGTDHNPSNEVQGKLGSDNRGRHSFRLVCSAVNRLRLKVEQERNWMLLGHLLPNEFTLRQAQVAYESILNKRVNKDSFRRSLVSSGKIEETERYTELVYHRPARLWRLIGQTVINF